MDILRATSAAVTEVLQVPAAAPASTVQEPRRRTESFGRVNRYEAAGSLPLKVDGSVEWSRPMHGLSLPLEPAARRI